jgi:hypothetical protein
MWHIAAAAMAVGGFIFPDYCTAYLQFRMSTMKPKLFGIQI